MTKYSEKLVSVVRGALSDSINDVSVLYAFVLLNKAIQDSFDVSEFRTIGFYRDWLVHTDLDRNERLKLFFERWDNVIEDIKKGSGRERAAEASQNILELPKLFAEIQNLGISLSPTQKTQFLVGLVNSLHDAPLRRNGKHIKEFRFTHDEEKKRLNPLYICHMQIQHKTGEWFNGPELLGTQI